MNAATKSFAAVNQKLAGVASTAAAHAATIDTRLVAAVQSRAGARVHEAAGLLQEYYLWVNLLARAERLSDQSLNELAFPQMNASRARLRKFLAGPCLAVA